MAAKTNKKEEAIDPITFSVVWSRLLNLTYECGERLHLGSQSWVMGAARDLGCVLLTPETEICTQVEFLACHTLGAEIPAKVMKSWFPKLDPGDMVLANDAHIIKAGHLPDWSTLSPIYYEGQIVYYVYIRGHQADTGGAFSGSYFPRAYDCISEGLNIPPVKIMKKGEVNNDAREVIFNNIRQREAVWSDLMIMYGSALKMRDGVCELIDKYGLETVKACTREMMRRDEMATREQIKEMADGVYYGECACDWDGTVPDRQVWARVKLIVKGDELIFDWSDSDDQVDFINSPLGNTHCYTYAGLFLTLDPGIPHNHGSMRAVTIIAPEGKCVNPTRPRTYGACACMLGCEIGQATLKALAQAVPDKVMGCPGWQFESDITGRMPFIDPRTGREQEYFANPFIAQGGSGAVKGYDGWDGVCGFVVMGSLKRGSVEESEMYLPIHYNFVKINEDSEGPGEFTGARGTYSERVCVIDPRGKMQIQAGNLSGATYPPYGAAGAPPAPLGEQYILRVGKKEPEVFKTVDYGDTFPGDVFMVTAMGSGGWGDPFNREPEKVRVAMRDGYLTAQRARSVYGVITTQKDKDNPETIEVDYKATKELRERLRGKPIYRHIDLVRDDVRNGKIPIQEAKNVYGVVFQPYAQGDVKNILVDYVATQELRNQMMAEAAK